MSDCVLPDGWRLIDKSAHGDIMEIESPNGDLTKITTRNLLAFADHVRAQRGEPDERKARDMIAEGYQWHPIYRCWSKPVEDADREKREFIRRAAIAFVTTSDCSARTSIEAAVEMWDELKKAGI